MNNKIYVDNSEFMELLDELTTQITEMNYGADTYEERKIFEGSYETLLSSEAQDFYNEKYDEFEGLLNRFKIHSNNDILSKYTCDSCGDRTESVCFDEDKDINECMDCM